MTSANSSSVSVYEESMAFSMTAKCLDLQHPHSTSIFTIFSTLSAFAKHFYTNIFVATLIAASKIYILALCLTQPQFEQRPRLRPIGSTGCRCYRSHWLCMISTKYNNKLTHHIESCTHTHMLWYFQLASSAAYLCARVKHTTQEHWRWFFASLASRFQPDLL